MTENIYNLYNIDINKLSRDYIKFPLNKFPYKNPNGFIIEKPQKEDLIYLYITLNLRRIDVCDYFNISGSTFDSWIKYYKIKKDIHKRMLNIQDTCYKLYKNKYYNNRDKCRNTFLKLYGKDWYTKTSEYKNKSKNTCNEKYGVTNPSYCQSVIEKRRKTFIKNNSFGKSIEEDKVYNILKKKYKIVERQWRKSNYPGFADFYIPEINTIIEYQGSWVHGSRKQKCNEPYDENNKHHREIIKLYKLKNSDGYNSAIKTWTIRDPKKRLWAKEHKEYSWIEFFTLDDFINWSMTEK